MMLRLRTHLRTTSNRPATFQEPAARGGADADADARAARAAALVPRCREPQELDHAPIPHSHPSPALLGRRLRLRERRA